MNDKNIKDSIYREVYKLRVKRFVLNQDSDFFKVANPKVFLKDYVLDFDNKNKDQLLYNYTSWSGFKAICESKSFQIGHARFMNDRHEFIYTRDLAMSALNKIGATQKEVNDFSDSWKTLPLQDNYIWSFSFNPESETLWNVYNGVNKGVSMAYSGASIMHALNNHLNPGIKSTDQIDFGNAFIAGLKVDYSEEFQKSTIKSIIIEWLYAYRAIEHNSKEAEEILMISAQALFFYALIFKNKYLSTEQEVRFLVIKKNLDNKIHADGKRDNKPYILCPIEPSNMLKSVTIQTNSTHSKNEVQNILDTSGFHCVKIYNSLMPY